MADATPDDALCAAREIAHGGAWEFASELVPLIAAAIREAVDAERERCALVAIGSAAVERRAGQSLKGKDCWEQEMMHKHAAECADTLAACIRQAPPAPAWTHEQPDREGWWWMRTPGGAPKAVLVQRHGNYLIMPTRTGFEYLYEISAVNQWCGPLEPPPG